MKFFASLLVWLLFSCLPVHAETITYTIKKMGMGVGTVKLSFGERLQLEGKPAELITFDADGFNFKDLEKIYVDAEAYRPILVLRDINIFGSKEKISERYVPNEGIIITKMVKGKKVSHTLQKAGAVDNIYGFIARYRKTGTFKVGEVLDVHLPTKDIQIALVRQEQVKVAGKTYDSYYMESKPAQYKIWFDAGPAKLPLKISGATGLANTLMEMTDYKE